MIQNADNDLSLKRSLTFGGGQKPVNLMIYLQSCYIDINPSKPIRKKQDYNRVNTFGTFPGIIDKKEELHEKRPQAVSGPKAISG
jgi:hypothetical protein